MRLGRTGTALTGSYSYRAYGGSIALTGTIDPDGNVTMTEKFQGRPTGAFKGALSGEALTGTWSDPTGQRALPFSFRVSNTETAPLASVQGGTAAHSACARVATSSVSRYGSTGTILPNGHVILVGSAIHDAAGPYSREVEEFDPVDHTLKKLPGLHVGRAKHEAALLADGRLLVVGGMSDEKNTVFSKSVELFDPAKNHWSDGPPIREGAIDQALLALEDGRAVLAGGNIMYKDVKLRQALVLDPKGMEWLPLPDAPEARAGRLAPLADGRLVFVGDTLNWNGDFSPTLDLLNLRGGPSWTSVASPIPGKGIDDVARISPSELALAGTFGTADTDGGLKERVVLVDGALNHPRELPAVPASSDIFSVDGALYVIHSGTVRRWDEPGHAWLTVATGVMKDGCSTTIPIPARGGHGHVLFAGTCDDKTSGALEMCDL